MVASTLRMNPSLSVSNLSRLSGTGMICSPSSKLVLMTIYMISPEFVLTIRSLIVALTFFVLVLVPGEEVAALVPTLDVEVAMPVPGVEVAAPVPALGVEVAKPVPVLGVEVATPVVLLTPGVVVPKAPCTPTVTLALSTLDSS